MIVKNEAHIIEETLKNIVENIKLDYWVISDTGSTDNTKEIITHFFESHKIPGELHQHQWKDFGHNRSKALEVAFNKSDYVLIFDADDKIYGSLILPKLEADSYLLKFGKEFTYNRILLVNNRKKWCFKGVLHEFICCLEKTSKEDLIKGNYYIESGRSGFRSKDPNKYYNDAIILEKAFLEEKDNSLKDRYAFYCAQSFKDCNKNKEAIEWYKKVLTLGNWNQEKYYSCLMLGNLYQKEGDEFNSIKYYLESSNFDKERIEGIVMASEKLRNKENHILVNLLYHQYKKYNKDFKNKLFVCETYYNDELEYNNSISAYYANDKISGYECCKKIIINNILPKNKLDITFSNILLYDVQKNQQLFDAVDNYLINNINYKAIDLHKAIYLHKAIDLWEKLLETNYNYKNLSNFTNKNFSSDSSPKIIITFTTCKRLDLFKKTLNSILHNWTDLDQIDYWFCVDDNSSEIDRKEMKNLYHWIDYYWKTPEEKGHRKSMNLIWDKLNKLKPNYWIHIEDDFLFHKKLNYIGLSIKYLKELENQNVHQILFNRNYAETIGDYKIMGHLPYNKDIVIHDHKKGTFNYPNCHYWPHYSFRPSIINTKIILELGNFNSPNQFFERDYADRYTAKGYKSAFFNMITCKHIGKLTSEINIPNAYNLNNVSQFNNKYKVVNLKRRADRKEKIINEFQKNNISNYEFIESVDGQSLISNPEIKKLFSINDFQNRRGVIGCALSHYKLWKKLIDDTVDYYLIMEDDVCLKNFNENIKLVDMSSKEIIFFGYSMREAIRNKSLNIYNSDCPIKLEKLKKDNFIGGTFCYSINKAGAKKLIDYIEENGIRHGIDYVIVITPDLECFESQPQLAFTEWNEFNKEIDTDIQYSKETLDLDDFGYVFFPGKDQIGEDIFYQKSDISEYFEIANKNEYIAFNTLGFFKKNIINLTPSKYFGKNDGIYVRKDYFTKLPILNTQRSAKDSENGKIRVKMICNWLSSYDLCQEFSNMCKEGYQWNNIEITWEDHNIDYYVIINKPRDNTYYDPQRTIVFQMEPWVINPNFNWGVKTWGEWAIPDESKFLAVRGRKQKCHNNAFWQLELNYNQLKNLEYNSKKECIASICSSKYFDEGHIARIDFLKFLEKKGDIPLDIFNKDNNHHFTNYRGPLTPYKDKSQGIVPYKYYFMAENNYEENFITEKIWEPIICETLVFYYGCPNILDHIDSQAFVLMDLNDFEKSYETIKKAIKEDWWSQRLPFIKKEKERILEELAFFPVIEKIIKQ